ncbi:MAG: DJ-1/PfpI family protein [Pirellulales bacterium]
MARLHRFGRTLRHRVLLATILATLAESSAIAEDPATAAPEPKRVAVLIFPGVELLDFAGPAEIFAGARDDNDEALFEVYTVAPSKTALKSLRFLSITPQYDPGDAPVPNILVIPGGNVETVMNNQPTLDWIKRQADEKCLMFSVCNGASVLGKLGLLDGLQVATHHGNIALLQFIAPKATCLPDRKFVDNGQIVTAAGISSGIDAALYVVSRLQGADAAKRVATYVEYDHFFGFDPKTIEHPATDSQGVVSQKGRVHHDKPWAITRLLNSLREQGFEAALASYPTLLKSAKGADRDMISSAGISMSANWLAKHTRDQALTLTLLKFNAAANPDSPLAHTDLGKSLLAAGDKAEAKASFERALKIDPKNSRAKQLLTQCQ